MASNRRSSLAVTIVTLVLLSGAGFRAQQTGTPTLQVNATMVLPGTPITVTVSNGPGFPLDWIGLHKAADPDDVYGSWMYLSGTWTAPTVGLTSTSFVVPAPMIPGSYDLRLFQNNGNAKLATSATITVPTIFVDPLTVPSGGVVLATINQPSTDQPSNATRMDWVGVYAVDDPDTAIKSWSYLGGTHTPLVTAWPSARFDIAMPVAPGTYNLRLFRNNGWVRVATSAPITVEGVVGFSVDSTTVEPGGTVRATISNGPGYLLDWVGVVSIGDPDWAYKSWRYLSGSQTPPVTALTDTTLDVTMPSTPGTYNLRLYRNNGSNVVATSAAITVLGPSVEVSSTSVTPGGVVTATVARAPGFPLDWVGVVATGDPDLAYQSWRYLSGTHLPPASALTSAHFDVTMPSTPGTYDLRLFQNNGMTLAAASATVTVAAIRPAITVTPMAVTAGAMVRVTIANAPGNALDWLGVNATGDPDEAYQSWRYLSGTQSPQAGGTSPAEIYVPMPSTPGSYNLRLFANNGMTLLAVSATITVTP